MQQNILLKFNMVEQDLFIYFRSSHIYNCGSFWHNLSFDCEHRDWCN